MTLGQRIRTILDEQHIKQMDLAEALSVSPNYISSIVNDKKNTISDTLAKLIEEKYGYSSQWILEEKGNKLINSDLTVEKNEIIQKIQKMNDSDARAVLAFINTLEILNNRFQ